MNNLTPYELSKKWVSKRFISFTVEDLKQAYKMAGGKITGNGSEWGNSLQQLAKNELIFKHPVNPFVAAKRPNNKTKYIVVWISKEMRLKQQKNASKETGTLNFNFTN